MFPSKNIVLLVLLTALLVACGPGSPLPVDAPVGLAAWIDAPLDGSTIPQEAYNIVFSAASSNGAVEQFEIQVNGVAEDNVAPMYESVEGDAKYYYSEYNWLPPAPGTYLIQVRAISGDEMGPFSQAEVMVDGVEVAIEPLPDEEPPPADEEDFPPDPVINVDTALFYYGGSCTPRAINVAIQTSDPEAYSLVLFYRLRGMDDQSELRTDWEAVAMNPGSEGFWRLTLPSSAIPDRGMFQVADFHLQIVGTYQGGEEFLRTAVVANQIVLLACGEEPPPPDEPADGDGPTPTPGIRIIILPPPPTPIPPPN